MTEPKISVIIPIYNADAHLRRCLDSVAAQTHNHLEILLVNDGSTDKSGAICDEYCAKDPRFSVIHKENGGVSSARNTGLAAATGDFIGWVDADDEAEPDLFAYLLQLLQAHSADVAQCGAYMDGDILFAPAETALLTAQNAAFLSHSLWNKLYRREKLDGISFDPALSIGEDCVFNAQVLTRAGTTVLGSEAKYHYFVNSDSTSHTAPALQKLKSICLSSRRAYSFHKSGSPLKNHYRSEVLLGDLDVCSKIVRFPAEAFVPLRKHICHKARLHTLVALTLPTLHIKDRTKYLLMAWCFPLYRKLLLKSKEKGMRDGR